MQCPAIQAGLKTTVNHKVRAVVRADLDFINQTFAGALHAKITPCFENGKLGVARGLANGIGFGSSEYIVLRPADILDAEFLYYFLARPTFLEEGAQRMAGAVGHKRVTKEFVESYRIPLPSLVEQRRIVAILDETFDGIATAKASAEKNLRSARAFSAEVIRAFLREAPLSWGRTAIGDQLTLQRGFDITKDAQRLGMVPVVSSGGIRSFHDTAMVSAPGVVIGRKGTLGKVFFLGEDFWPHDTTLWVKDFKGNSPRFVFHFFSVLDVQWLDSGAANPALNRNQVHSLRVAWPSLHEQRAAADRFDAVGLRAAELVDIYQRKIIALDELKRAILGQAFNGAL